MMALLPASIVVRLPLRVRLAFPLTTRAPSGPASAGPAKAIIAAATPPPTNAYRPRLSPITPPATRGRRFHAIDIAFLPNLFQGPRGQRDGVLVYSSSDQKRIVAEKCNRLAPWETSPGTS